MSRTAISVNSKEVEQEFKRLNRNLNILRNQEGDRAVASVLNRGATRIGSLARRKSAKSIGVKNKVIKSRFQTAKKAKSSDLTTKVRAYTRPINAASAGAKKTDSGMQLGPYEWEGAFLWNGRGKPLAIQRKTKKRYPLKAAELGKKLVYTEMKKAMDSAFKTFQGDYRLELHKELSKRFDRLLK